MLCSVFHVLRYSKLKTNKMITNIFVNQQLVAMKYILCWLKYETHQL